MGQISPIAEHPPMGEVALIADLDRAVMGAARRQLCWDADALC